MKSMIDGNKGQLFDLNFLISLLDGFYPRLLSQIDRDPDSPTFGSCDRHFWMYRLNDFDSGVVQQTSLTLAALDRLADQADFSACRNLSRTGRAYWRELALAINRRNVRLLGGNGYMDEYYPGEQSFPATVFAAYATLKSAAMLGQDEIIRSPGLAKTAARLLTRRPSAAANQDMACAAFLALYGKTLNWRTGEVMEAVSRMLTGPDGQSNFQEYGGLDLGYATVSLNYLAYMLEDESFPAEDAAGKLARTISDFVTPGGRLGGEFAARSTTYFLPFGLFAAASTGNDPTGRFQQLDLAAGFDKLDDRYLMHYCLPSLAMTALKRARDRSDLPVPVNAPAGWIAADHSRSGLFACRNADAAAFIGLNKGGAVQAETPSETVIDCGYRVQRGNKVYATCVVDDGADFKIEEHPGGVVLEVNAPFQRYASLVASPLKFVILRILGFMGPTLNAYFKSRLIKSTEVLANARLRRRIVVDYDQQQMTIEDEVSGLTPEDALFRSPPWSLRLVPSAKFYQDGEENDASSGERAMTERAFSRVVSLARE